MNYSKPFKEISELLEILKNRRLIINDYQFATDFLHNVNYYRLSAYYIPFYESPIYLKIMLDLKIFVIFMNLIKS